jgi:epoxide hydrolase
VVIEPLTINVPDATLDDLSERLARTRFPNEVTGVGWEQGTPLAYLRELVEYWRDEYDWRAHEAELNSYDNFVHEVDGQPIHFMHVKSPHAEATPLLLAHGWPGSVVEFLDTIEPFVNPPDPVDAFSLVIPSLPGYAFSAPTTEAGWSPRRIAQAFGTLMGDLGYEHYGVQGGDWGSIVVCNMADLFPGNVTGLHVNFLTVPPPKGESPREPSEPSRRFNTTGNAYSQIQGTKPQTIGYLLEDSPAGLAGWIIEKFREWSDCGGEPENAFTKDQMLTNIMLYWVNAAATSSARLYWEMRQSGAAAVPGQVVTVPTGVANFPGEISRSQRADAERRYNIVHWTEHDRGGHFAAMEQPELFVHDVRSFFRGLG